MSTANPTPIALCITGLEPGGAERCLTELAKGLDRERFAPVIYCLSSEPTGSQAIFVDELCAAGLNIHFLGAQSNFDFPLVVAKLTRLFKKERPQLVQSFLFHANVTASMAAFAARVPHVLSGIRVAEPRRSHLWMTHQADRCIERHVCVSQAVADYMRTVGKLPAEKLVVIPNGVKLDRFANIDDCDLAQFGIHAGRRVLVFIGRLDAQKGLEWLLRLAPRIFGRFPQHDLLVVGQGPDRNLFEQTVRDLGIVDRVRFTGWRADVPAILAKCDVLLVPSRWEGMPNVVLEAMASGKPVVACDVEGVRELLGSAAGLQTVYSGNSDAFVECLANLLENPAILEETGRQNRLRVEQSFGLAAMVAAYERLFISLLG